MAENISSMSEDSQLTLTLGLWQPAQPEQQQLDQRNSISHTFITRKGKEDVCFSLKGGGFNIQWVVKKYVKLKFFHIHENFSPEPKI